MDGGKILTKLAFKNYVKSTISVSKSFASLITCFLKNSNCQRLPPICRHKTAALTPASNKALILLVLLIVVR